MKSTSSRLSGRRLKLMRLSWAVMAIISVALYLPSLPHKVQKAIADPTQWLEIVTEAFYLVLGAVIFWLRSVGGFIWGMFVILFPLSIAISILRFHLWDIDIIIRKTLQYTAITTLLALIYFGSVLLFQRLFSGITGEQSPLALVVSTLLIAAIFAPFRRRIQEGIDRRFYRKKYDAQQVLAAFARTARDETDPSLSLRTGMEALLAELERVIQETLQPDGVRVWLRDAKGLRTASHATNTKVGEGA